MLNYGIGITNTVDSLMVNQLGMGSLPRWLLSGVLIAVLMLVMVSSQRIMLIVTQWLVYPLIAILLFVSLYLIPSWDLDGLATGPSAGELIMSV